MVSSRTQHYFLRKESFKVNIPMACREFTLADCYTNWSTVKETFGKRDRLKREKAKRMQ